MAARVDNGKARDGVYKLGAIAAPDIRFELNGCEWRIPADPDVEYVALMLQLDRELRGFEEEGADRPLAQSMIDGRDLILDLIAQRPQKQELPAKFRIGVGEILQLFGLITGGPSVADWVAEGLTAGITAARSLDELTDEEKELLEAGEEDAAPLPSTKRSSGQRSRSAGSTSGRQRGGGA